MAERIKVFELDFGDINLLDPDPQVILDLIKSEMQDMKEGDKLDYTITMRCMTKKELNDLPEWSL